MTDKEEQNSSFKVADNRRFDSEGDVREEISNRAESASQSAPSGNSEADRKDSKARDAGLPEISFGSFVVSLATQALMQLGELPPPPGVQLEEDAAAAKQTIDILIMLREKTKGNLDKAEEDLIEEVLHSVQMTFVRRATHKK